jgi:hypothetical protein
VSASGHCTLLWRARRVLLTLPEGRFADKDVVHWTDLRSERPLRNQYDPDRELEDLRMSELVSPPGPIDIRVITSIAAMAGVFSASPVGIAKNSSDLSYHQLRDGAGPGRGALQSRRRRAGTGRFLEAAGGALDAGGRSQS